MAPDPRELLPQHKSDVARAQEVIALGYPAVAPVLPELLEWLLDCNWPVSHPIGDFLATLPEAMAPMIWQVLQGDDLGWKYWCIVRLIRVMPTHVAEQFRGELSRLANDPTANERSEELDEVAQETLRELWPSSDS